MTVPTAPAAAEPASRPLPVPVWPLVLITVVNYLWQIPYAVHHYGHRWESLPKLSIPLLLTGVWFGAAIVAMRRGSRGGRVLLGSFLVLEAAFYLIHNASGAFGADLPGSDPILFIASVLGYLSAATAIIYLLVLAWSRQRAGT
jgi:hypothetical protein